MIQITRVKLLSANLLTENGKSPHIQHVCHINADIHFSSSVFLHTSTEYVHLNCSTCSTNIPSGIMDKNAKHSDTVFNICKNNFVLRAGHVAHVVQKKVQTGFWWEKAKESDQLEDLAIDGRILNVHPEFLVGVGG
jgi:hypothetical protein